MYLYKGSSYTFDKMMLFFPTAAIAVLLYVKKLMLEKKKYMMNYNLALQASRA